MNYIIKLIDDDGEILMAEETPVGEVAQKFLDISIKMETELKTIILEGNNSSSHIEL